MTYWQTLNCVTNPNIQHGNGRYKTYACLEKYNIPAIIRFYNFLMEVRMHSNKG